jgi:predicted aconitase
MALQLTSDDRAVLAGASGEGLALAMRVLTAVAEAMGATGLLDISGAHIDGCLYQGQVGLDFVERLAVDGARVKVPTTLNVGSIDLLHPELYQGDPAEALASRRLMQMYEDLGCLPTWTCAPYQLAVRPALGEQVAWAESNAIVFANSVLGARTHRYGDFLDVCAALTGRAPAAGLHLDENRRAEVVFDVSNLAPRLLASDVLFPALGHIVGAGSGNAVPAIVGLPAATEDQLKALGAAAAAAGAVAMFHAVGITPEAPDLATALHGRAPRATVKVTPAAIRKTRDQLSTLADGPIGAVCVGTPHASLAEMEQVAELLAGRRIATGTEAYISTGRDIAAQANVNGTTNRLTAAGFTVVTDTCTYVSPVLRGSGPVMTDSAKWAYYAPANMGVDVIFGSLAEVIESAVAGSVRRDESLWSG